MNQTTSWLFQPVQPIEGKTSMSNWESFFQCFGVESETKRLFNHHLWAIWETKKKNLLSIITDWLRGILITYSGLWLTIFPLIPFTGSIIPYAPSTTKVSFETPSKNPDFQGFPNIQHLREILKSHISPKSWRKTTETPRKFHMFVGLFVCFVVYFCRYILFF